MKVFVCLLILAAAALAEPPVNNYGPPPASYGPPTDTYGPPKNGNGKPPGTYGPPKNGNGKPPKPVYGPPSDEEEGPASYHFEYAVKDDESGNDFGHEESREGDVAQGKYYVLLPDGRKQIVEYTADSDGYHPKVSYEEGAGGAGGYPPSNGGYPPSNGGYSPSNGGHPPSNGGHPPSNGGYPPSNGGYPPAGDNGGYRY